MFMRLLKSPVVHALLYAGFIFALSSYTCPPVLGPLAMNDKGKHFALYGVFAILVARALLPYLRRPALIAFLTILIASLYGASDEYHQRFTPGRSCDVKDWMADSAAALVVSVCLLPWTRRRA